MVKVIITSKWFPDIVQEDNEEFYPKIEKGSNSRFLTIVFLLDELAIIIVIGLLLFYAGRYLL